MVLMNLTLSLSIDHKKNEGEIVIPLTMILPNWITTDLKAVEADVESCDVDEGATGEENLVNSIDDELWESDFSTSDSDDFVR